MQDQSRSLDRENIWKGKVLFEAYSKFVIDNDLLPDHLKQEKNKILFNSYYYWLYPIIGASFAGFVINPLFLARNSAITLKRLVVFAGGFIGYINGNNRFYKSLGQYDQMCYQYYPNNVKLFKMTLDHRFLTLMELNNENFDSVTKLPNF